MEGLDYWRLCDELSVLQAALLVVGCYPGRPILGLRFATQRAKLDQAGAASRCGSRVDEPAAHHADNVL